MNRFPNAHIQYVHWQGSWYEIEIPDVLVKGELKPEDYEFVSKRKGLQWFHTNWIWDKVKELENAEEDLSMAFNPFVTLLFQTFFKKSHIWNKAVSLIAELDCLSSLSCFSLS